jgi:hypothetical protein
MKGENQSGVSTISLGRLQYIRRGTAEPTERRSLMAHYGVRSTNNAMHTNLYLHSCSRNQPSQKCYSLIKYELQSTFQTPDGTIQHPKTTFRPTGYRYSMHLSSQDLSNIRDRLAPT